MEKTSPIVRISRHVFIEIPFFFLAITLLEVFIFGSAKAWISQTTIQIPHPYWIGILLFSLTYGVFEGTTSAIIAGGLFVSLSPFKFGENPLDWGNTTTLPLFFIITGILVGLIRNQRKKKIDETSTHLQKLDKQLTELHKIAYELNRSNLNLEKKIVFRLETFQTVYEIAEQLNKLHLDQLYKNIPQLVAKYFHAEQCSFFLVETGESLDLKSTYGWTKPTFHPLEYDSQSAIFKKLSTLQETRVLSGEELQGLDHNAVFIVALITQEKKLLGMIKIEQIEFMKITRDNLKFLSLLSKWFTQSIVNGLRYAQKEKESTFDPRTGLVREETFWFMVKKIVASAVRHKYDTVLMNLSLRFPNEIGTIEKNILIHNIGAICKKVFRIDDEVGIADFNRTYNFMVMMPYTNRDQAKVVTKKTTSAIFDQLGNEYPYVKSEEFLSWEILSLEDGTLFLSETVQQMIFDPILAGKA